MTATTPDTPVMAAATARAADPPLVRRPKKKAGPLEWIAVHLVFLLVCAFFLIPFLWLLSAAFDEKASAYIQLPVAPTIMNFVRLFSEHDFGRVLLNSLFVAIATNRLFASTRPKSCSVKRRTKFMTVGTTGHWM